MLESGGMTMDKVFQESYLGGIRLKNRIIRSATGDGYADNEGRPTRKMIELYERLARGGAGAIITGFIQVQRSGKAATFNAPLFDRDEFIDDYRKLTAAMHGYGTPIIAQLNHCGRQTRSKLSGMPTVAPSARRDLYFLEKRPKALTELEIEDIIDHFVQAIGRCKKAGFDGVQLHCAHGFLLSAFLSSNTNCRKDRWGGSLENKFRIIERIFKVAKALVGDYPILVKINAYDTRKKGMRVPEAVEIAKLLQRAGCAAIEVSCGMANDGFITVRSKKFPTDAALAYSYVLRWLPVVVKKIIKPFIPFCVSMVVPPPKELENFNVAAAHIIKQQVDIPVIVVGGIKKMIDIERIIGENSADYVAMSRAFICEPDIVNRFREKRQAESSCISCNFCITCIESRPYACFMGKL
jgi:2,4-dienoyl-CoA reductase-like NADH-dependent reductase (Old Yellow Enzyme family)